MSSFWAKLGRMLPGRSVNRVYLVGRDLKGNSYFEHPNPNGGRPKRTVEYIETGNDPLDYRSGTQQLPVQWSAWMSYTRDSPPSMAELQGDAARQMALRERVKVIEARERAERIEQGYLREDGSAITQEEVPNTLKLGGAVWINEKSDAGQRRETPQWSTGDGGVPHSGAKFAFPPKRKVERDDRRAARMQRQSEADAVEGGEQSGGGERIAPPRAKVDALSQDPSELRKLAEEDTRRRMKESGVAESKEGAAVEPAAFAPRRRGK